jgi:hypothetical protein
MRFQRWELASQQIPGALPQAKMKTAPLALNTYSSRPWEDSALDLHFRVGACKRNRLDTNSLVNVPLIPLVGLHLLNVSLRFLR